LLSGGKTARLYRRLVIDQEIAAEVTASNQVNRLPGCFLIQLEVMKGKERKKAEEALLVELQKLIDTPMDEAELKRVKHNIIASIIFSREGVHELADAIVNTVAVTDLSYIKTYLPRLEAVTAKDVQEIAKKYFDPQKRVVVFSVPEPDGNAPKKTEPPKKPQRQHAQQKPGPGKGASAVDLTKVKRQVLPNGLTMLMLENHRLPIVYAEAYVKDTQLYEPKDKAGLAKLVGHVLTEGTNKHKEADIANLVDSIGAQFHMSATGGSVKVLSPDLPKGLDLMFECLIRSTFPKDSVKRYKEHLQSEIEDVETKPDSKAEDVFLQTVYGDHPLGSPINGSDETVEGLNATQCRDFHKKLFVPNNTILVVVGDFDADSVVKQVTDMTKDWKEKKLPNLNLPKIPEIKEFTQRIIPLPNSAQVYLYLGHIGIRRSNPDYYKLLVMDNVLGTGPGFTDRLSSHLRDREGLAYTVTANITASSTEEPGVFSCYIGTDPKNFQKVKKMLLDEIETLRKEPPTEEEVADAKKYLLGHLPFELKTNDNVADQILNIERYNLGWDYTTTFRKKIESVTAADIQEMAKKYLHPDKMVLVAAGPIDGNGKPTNGKEKGKDKDKEKDN
jgi:zinc protease